MNVEETEAMRILRTPSPVKNIIDQKQPGECGLFKVFGQHDNKRCKKYTGN